MDSSGLERRREQKRLAAKARSQRLRAAGLCRQCGKVPFDVGYMTCGPCRAAERIADSGKAKARRAARIAEGLCIACGKAPASMGKLCDRCGVNHKRDVETRMARLTSEGRCMFCGKPKEHDTRSCDSCRARFSKWGKETRAAVRSDVMEHYGGAFCACCGESEPVMLTIDHMNNDGAAHRKEIRVGGASTSFYRWIQRNDYPPGFQVLCYNCNIAKFRNGGACPHQEMSA